MDSFARFTDGKTEGGGTQYSSGGHTVRGRNRFESLASQAEQLPWARGSWGLINPVMETEAPRGY